MSGLAKAASVFHFYLLKTHDSIKDVTELEEGGN